MLELTVCNTAIRQDANGRFCLNDLHRAAVAAGANERTKEPAKFFTSPQTVELVRELTDTQNPGIAPVSAIKGGPQQGTYVCRELVYAYAMWISAAFNLQVIRAYDAMVARPSAIAVPQSLPEALRLAADLAEGKARAEAQLAVAGPKAQALDAIATSSGMWNVSMAAKLLQMKPFRLFDWLSQNKWSYRRAGGSGNWVAYQDKIQSGYLTHKVFTKPQDDGSDKGYPQMMVTPKGLATIATLMGVQLPANDLFGKDAA